MGDNCYCIIWFVQSEQTILIKQNKSENKSMFYQYAVHKDTWMECVQK